MNHETPQPAQTPPDAVEETIAAYDSDAETYGRRFANVDFGPYLARFIEAVEPGTWVLDAGCGSGRDLARLTGRGFKAVGVDRSGGILGVARRTAPSASLVRGDLRRLPFPDSVFGGVWHCASLLHLSPADAATAIADVRRVLMTNGTLFLSVASGRGTEWRMTPTGRRWFSYYSQTELEQILKDAGLEIVSSTTEAGIVHGTWINAVTRKATR